MCCNPAILLCCLAPPAVARARPDRDAGPAGGAARAGGGGGGPACGHARGGAHPGGQSRVLGRAGRRNEGLTGCVWQAGEGWGRCRGARGKGRPRQVGHACRIQAGRLACPMPLARQNVCSTQPLCGQMHSFPDGPSPPRQARSSPPLQALIESAEAWQRQLEGLMRGRPAIKRVRARRAAC